MFVWLWFCSAATPALDRADSASGNQMENPAVRLISVTTTGLQQPLFLTHAGDGSGRLFVVEQDGRIRIVDGGILQSIPFLEIADRVLSGGERGLLGLAFHPGYKRNGRLFVNYTRKPDGATVVAEYHRSDNPARALANERVLMLVSQPHANHNGGMIAFGPDGYLYIGRGDGGAGGDPQNRSQNRDDLLGKILRIDVDHGDPYGIPGDNPFVSGGGRPEIFALGLRNPWRFSFDRDTGSLWIADVGQDKWEEIDLVLRGKNYGWRIMEGSHCYSPKFFCDTTGLTPPVAEYGHEGGRCSVTGGYVYRGTKSPALRGWYLYADYCSGELFGLPASSNGRHDGAGEPTVLLRTGLRVSSFGEDDAGELYVIGHAGTVHRLTAVESK
jgi:glucose/arabinose dehydrogenase